MNNYCIGQNFHIGASLLVPYMLRSIINPFALVVAWLDWCLMIMVYWTAFFYIYLCMDSCSRGQRAQMSWLNWWTWTWRSCALCLWHCGGISWKWCHWMSASLHCWPRSTTHYGWAPRLLLPYAYYICILAYLCIAFAFYSDTFIDTKIHEIVVPL